MMPKLRYLESFHSHMNNKTGKLGEVEYVSH